MQSQRFLFSLVSVCSFSYAGDDYPAQFSVRAEIDPLDDEAVLFLQTLVVDRAATDFLSAPFIIEESEGIITFLPADIGIKGPRGNRSFVRLKRYSKNHFFKNNFAMRAELHADIGRRFVLQELEFVLPFYRRWFSVTEEDLIAILRTANYVEIPLNIVYLMRDGERTYFPQWQVTFVNCCAIFPSMHCL